MKLQLDRFDDARDSADWDALCATAPMATLLHTRRFLSYHGERFLDESRVLRDEKQHILAVFPAARLPGQPDIVCSHPGATFGGLVHAGNLLGEDLLQALALIAADYQRKGFTGLRYKLTPHIYHRWPAQDDQYALWRLGAELQRCDLSSTIDLDDRREPGSRRRRALKNAQAAQITISENSALLEAFWPVLTTNLASQHDARPVHALQEMQELMRRFPDQISLLTAVIGGALEAGILLFNSARVSHAQYIACSPEGREHHALDALFEHGIARARQHGCRYFDFGISNEDDGRRLNRGLYQFKSEFGGGGAVHAFLHLALTPQLSERCDGLLA